MNRQVLLMMASVWLASLHVECLANGGPFSTSAIERTGDLVPVQKKTIKLEQETLNVRLDAERAHVAVVYQLRNSESAEDVTFAFPVRLMEPRQDRQYAYGYDKEDTLTNFKVFDGAQRVAVSRTSNKALEELTQHDLGNAVQHWSIMRLHFNAGERKTLRVNYSVRCAGVIDGFDGDFNWKFTPRTFTYSFGAAAGWGDGRVGKLDIVVDTTFLQERGLKLISVQPPPQSNAPKLMWSFQNLDLANAPDLVCAYDSAPMLYQEHAQSYLLKPGTRGGLTVSESLSYADADTRSLLDRDIHTAWIASGDKKGLGTKIRLQPTPNTRARDISILNGHTASAEMYRAYARIKKLCVEQTWTDDDDVLHHDPCDKDFPDEDFNNLPLRFPTYAAKLVVESPNPGITRYVEMTVMELYPGTEGKPLAISEIYLYGASHGR